MNFCLVKKNSLYESFPRNLAVVVHRSFENVSVFHLVAVKTKKMHSGKISLKIYFEDFSLMNLVGFLGNGREWFPLIKARLLQESFIDKYG
jgi:hypothetical protein